MWFREKQGIILYTSPLYEDFYEKGETIVPKWFFLIFINGESYKKVRHIREEDPTNYTTHEKALEAGLLKACEIVLEGS